MADNNQHIAYSLSDIQRYLQGSMSAKEMHELKRAALEDPFLADALEGYAEADLNEAQKHLAQIDVAIRHQQPAKVIKFNAIKKYNNWQVAAAVILLVCIAGVTYFIFYKKPADNMLASNVSNSAVAKKDSVQVPLQTIMPPLNDTSRSNNSIKIAETKNNSLTANKKAITPAKQPIKTNARKKTLATDSGKAALTAGSNQRLAAVNEFTGIIADNNQKPVPNARILLTDSTQAVTDKNGYFTIVTNDSIATAMISAFGYKPMDKVQLKKGYNSIVLKERPFLLSDVEVTNIGTTAKNKKDTSVTLQGGWQTFQQYVYEKLHKKYDSTAIISSYNDDLQLEFSIDEDGYPVDFKVLHSPDSRIAADAINAIKDGPKWSSNDKNKKMRITVKYK